MKEFMRGKWRNLILISYKVDPSILVPHLPPGTELDTYNGNTFISLVAFEFQDTVVRGVRWPFHINFPEVNLRFYGKAAGQKGAIFLAELISKPIVAWIAKHFFNEPYYYCSIQNDVQQTKEEILVQYTLEKRGKKFTIDLVAENKPFSVPEDSLEHFLKEHCRGYGIAKNGKALKYNVAHKFWRIYPIKHFKKMIDYGLLYGKKWEFLNNLEPDNVTFAEGSDIKVFEPTLL